MSAERTDDGHLTFWQRLQRAGEWYGVPSRPIDVARELGLGKNSVTKYVQGGRPLPDKIRVLAKNRAVRAEWLEYGLGEMVAEAELHERLKELLQIGRNLPEDAQERLLTAARYELHQAASLTTGSRKVLTDELIRILEKSRGPGNQENQQ